MQLGLFRACDEPEHLHTLLVGQLEQALLGLEAQQPAPRRSQHADSAAAGKNAKPSRGALPGTVAAGDGALAADDIGAVWRVGLQATLIGPIVWEQTQLFDQADVKHRQHLARLIDTLSGRLGRGQVLEARIERDAEPEQAVSYRPLTGRRRDGSEQKTVHKLNSRLASSGAEPRPSDPLRRPTRLYAPPEPLAGVSCGNEGVPTEFVFENRRERVLAHWGPERLESGWWRGPCMRREYYRVETSRGDWWWIYRELASGQWYVHGLFG
jgi:protein ImuB